MKKIILILSVAIFFLFWGCDKETKDESNKDNEPKVSNNDESENNESNNNENEDDDDFASNMKKLEEMMSGGEDVQVVNFRELKDLLPAELEDMNRTSASGEKSNAFGIKVSKAEGEYKSEDSKQKIKITIMDMGSMKGLAGMTAFAWSWAEIDKETDDGFERTFEYKGRKAFEKYNTKYQDGEIQVLVAERFMVEVNGSNVPIELLRAALDEIDLDNLEDMKAEVKEDE